MQTKQPHEQRPDALIDEVRAIRQAIWDDDGHDLARHIARLRLIEQKYPGRIAPAPAAHPAAESTETYP